MPDRKPDYRPRFGYCYGLDNEPQIIYETVSQYELASQRKRRQAVVVIPLAYHSPKQKAKIRAFAKTYLAPA